MVKSVSIRNFRCFADATAHDCRRINIIVGDNASGKTAFLEAIFLAAGSSPEIALRMRAWRGLESDISGPARHTEEALWGDLFHNLDKTQSIAINLIGAGHHTRSVTIVYKDIRRQSSKSRKVDRSLARAHDGSVTFIYRGRNNRHLGSSTPRFVEGKIEIPPLGDSLLNASYFAANRTYSSAETVRHFSDISRRSEAGELIENFRSQFPFVNDVSIEVLGGEPYIFAEIDDMQEKMPINSLSAGMNKLVALLFAFPGNRDGIIIIDEIENGFYYKRLGSIWNAIHHFSTTYNTQIFASTHSIECLHSAAEVAKLNPDDFSIIQAAEGRLHQFSGDKFVKALNQNIEIR